MRKVPVVFSIDRNVVVPFTVCVTSLLEHARPDTFYELFVLCDGEELGEELRNEARRAELASENCRWRRGVCRGLRDTRHYRGDLLPVVDARPLPGL